mgnify:CR=1 FL=1
MRFLSTSYVVTFTSLESDAGFNELRFRVFFRNDMGIWLPINSKSLHFWDFVNFIVDEGVQVPTLLLLGVRAIFAQEQHEFVNEDNINNDQKLNGHKVVTQKL